MLFYEMLNGHSPFEAEDHLATYQKILDGTVRAPRARCRAQPPARAARCPPRARLGGR